MQVEMRKKIISDIENENYQKTRYSSMVIHFKIQIIFYFL